MIKKKLNILFVIQKLEIGGAERQLIELLKGINRKKFFPMLVCFEKGGGFVGEVKKIGVPLYFIERRTRWDFGLIIRLSRFMKEKKIDITQSFLFLDNFYSLIAGVLAQVPKRIVSARGLEYRAFSVKGIIDRLLFLFSAYIVTNSKYLKKYLLNTGHPSDKIVVIYNGFDERQFNIHVNHDKICAKYKLSKVTKKVGIVARLHPMKDHATFLNMAIQVLRHYQNVQFIVVGDGELMNKLKTFVEKNELKSNIIFTGEVENPVELVSRFNVLCSSSCSKESLSNSLIEAIFLGIPVVGTRLAGTPEIISDKYNGFLVPIGDYQEMAKKVITLLNDENLEKEIGRKGKRLAKDRFSLKRMIFDYEKVWTLS